MIRSGAAHAEPRAPGYIRNSTPEVPSARMRIHDTDELEAEQLDADELVRYGRHLSLPSVGEEGQLRLKNGRVLLVGAGGLGSPAALYLAAAGVGTIGIVDFDLVDASNLQRQVLHDTHAIGRAKTESARERIAALNPRVRVETHETELTAANALDIVRGYDVVLDGTDNFRTRYLVNDACVILGRPNVYGSVLRFDGQASVFATPNAPCYRCLFPSPPPAGSVPSCAEAGVLGVLPGLVGTIQATEAIKLLLGAGETLEGRLLLVDALRMRFRTVALERDPACPACGTREIREPRDEGAACDAPAAVGEGDDSPGVREMSPAELARRMGVGDAIEVVDVREPYEWRVARIEGSRLVPLSAFGEGARALDPSRETVLLCHHGVRSMAAAEHLAALGFRRVWSLAGGIDRWSREVDPRVPRY